MKFKKYTLVPIACILFLLTGTVGCMYQVREKLKNDVIEANDKLQKKYHPQTWNENQFAAQPYV